MERRVMFAPVLGIIYLVVASFIVVASLSIGAMMPAFTGSLLLLISILYIMSPAVVYTNQEIRLKNLFGMTVQTHKFSEQEITVRDRKIYVGQNRLKILVPFLKKRDYADLLSHIQTLQLEKRQSFHGTDDSAR